MYTQHASLHTNKKLYKLEKSHHLNLDTFKFGDQQNYEHKLRDFVTV